jgi:mono/diheme cytochrome c family protein
MPAEPQWPRRELYRFHCQRCHGPRLYYTPQGVPVTLDVGGPLKAYPSIDPTVRAAVSRCGLAGENRVPMPGCGYTTSGAEGLAAPEPLLRRLARRAGNAPGHLPRRARSGDTRLHRLRPTA